MTESTVAVPVRITGKADYRKAGWWKVGVVAEYLDSTCETLPEAEYAVAQFRHKGDAYNYAKQLADRYNRSNNPPVAILIF